MKLLSATVLAASMLPNINGFFFFGTPKPTGASTTTKSNVTTKSTPKTCDSPLKYEDGDKPQCFVYKKKSLSITKCRSKAAMKMEINKDWQLCAKSKCLTYKKKKNGKLTIKIGSKGTPITFERVDGKKSIVVSSPNELKGQFPRFAGNQILFEANDSKGVINCSNSIQTTKAKTTKATTTQEPSTEASTTAAPTTKKPNVYIEHRGGCMPLSDRWPTAHHPLKTRRRQVYANGTFEDFWVVQQQTIPQCKALCDREAWCIGFEYAAFPQPSWITFKAFKAGDCQLNFRDNRFQFRAQCTGWALNYFEKRRTL